MELRDLVEQIGVKYDRRLPMNSEAQQLLRQAPASLADLLPADMLPAASGGKGAGAVVPWIAVFQPDETTTAQRGMYVVYLFSADMATVTLSLNQGVTDLINRFGTRAGREKLAGQAGAIRANLPAEQISDLDAAIDLRSSHALPRNYEAGNIVAIKYQLTALPTNDQMTNDLHRLVRLYQLALETRQQLRLSTPDAVVTTSPVEPPAPDVEFKPKDDSDYIQHISAKTVHKHRDHERVVKLYGPFLTNRGFTANTKVHPRDLTASRGHDHWLIEIKVVYRGNGVQATRDALSQLLMYRDFLYPADQDVNLLAVFSEDIGDLNVGFLEHHGIASVWKAGATWAGSETARKAGLADS